jgi:hypothetical protein
MPHLQPLDTYRSGIHQMSQIEKKKKASGVNLTWLKQIIYQGIRAMFTFIKNYYKQLAGFLLVG